MPVGGYGGYGAEAVRHKVADLEKAGRVGKLVQFVAQTEKHCRCDGKNRVAGFFECRRRKTEDKGGKKPEKEKMSHLVDLKIPGQFSYRSGGHIGDDRSQHKRPNPAVVFRHSEKCEFWR